MAVRNVHDFYQRHHLELIPELLLLLISLAMPKRLFARIEQRLRAAATVLTDAKKKVEKRLDLAFSTYMRGDNGRRQRAIILIELKSRLEKSTPMQIAGYFFRLLEQHKLPVYPLLIYTGNYKEPLPSVWDSLAEGKAAQLPPAFLLTLDVLYLQNIPDRVLLAHRFGVFAYVYKNIYNLDDKQLTIVLARCHHLIEAGKGVEVNLLIDYIVVVKKNGVSRRRLAAVERKHFPNLAEELRVMPRYATSFDIVAEKAHAEGKAKGHAEGKARGHAEGKAKGHAAERSKIALAMLKEGESEAKICRVTELSRKELQLLKRSLKK